MRGEVLQRELLGTCEKVRKLLRKVVPSGLLNGSKIILEGQPGEPLPPEQVYISPALGKAYDGERGDTIESLPPDAKEIDKTIWYGFGWGKKKQSSPPQSVATGTTGKKWFELPEGINRLRTELLEMKRYFPEFELYQDDSGLLIWKGNVGGLGEVEILYPEGYPVVLPRLAIAELTEAEKAELAGNISEHHSIMTPTVALVIAVKYFLARRIPNAVVPNSRGSEKT